MTKSKHRDLFIKAAEEILFPIESIAVKLWNFDHDITPMLDEEAEVTHTPPKQYLSSDKRSLKIKGFYNDINSKLTIQETGNNQYTIKCFAKPEYDRENISEEELIKQYAVISLSFADRRTLAETVENIRNNPNNDYNAN